MRPADTIL